MFGPLWRHRALQSMWVDARVDKSLVFRAVKGQTEGPVLLEFRATLRFMAIQFATQRLRKKVVFLICEYKAILALTFNLKPDDAAELDKTRAKVIQQSTRRELEGLMQHWTAEVKRIRQTYK